MAIVPRPHTIVASSAAARAMNVDAWKAGSMTIEASLTSAAISVLSWRLTWKWGNAVSTRSPAITKPGGSTARAALT